VRLLEDKQRKEEEQNRQESIKQKALKWLGFDLKQSTTCTGLDITLENPLIIFKDRPHLPSELQFDLGIIHITSHTEMRTGRWLNLPDQLAYETTMEIDCKQMGIRILEESGQLFHMTSPYDLNVKFDKLNYTPLLSQSFLSPQIDPRELDIGYKILMKYTPVKMFFKQSAYRYMLRCMDLNLNYSDGLHNSQYMFYVWTKEDADNLYKEEDVVNKFKGQEVYKMKVQQNFPSMSVTTLHEDSSFMAELVLCNC